MDYNLNDFKRCPEHGCVMMQVQDLPPVCLIEWLIERAGDKTVRDVIPAAAGSDLQAVILANGFLLPVLRAVRVEQPAVPLALTLENVAGWYVSDVLSIPGEDAVAVELLPPQVAAESEQTGIFLQLRHKMLLFLLFDEQIRKVEP